MSIHQVLAILEDMEADGIVHRYAIGGAVGATFYLEPVATLDVDVFVALEASPRSLLVELGAIFLYLGSRGGRAEGEHIHLAGWPVQLLPSTGPLVSARHASNRRETAPAGCAARAHARPACGDGARGARCRPCRRDGTHWAAAVDSCRPVRSIRQARLEIAAQRSPITALRSALSAP